MNPHMRRKLWAEVTLLGVIWHANGNRTMERDNITYGENKQRPRVQEPTFEDPLFIEDEYTWGSHGERQRKTLTYEENLGRVVF